MEKSQADRVTKDASFPTIAVDIPSYRHEEVLCQTIQEILKQSIRPNEFVIIDQTEEHKLVTKSFLREFDQAGRLRWIQHSPASLSMARNRALKETESDILLFIDDDILTYPKFIHAHLINYLDPSIDAVCGQVRPRDGKIAEKLPGKIDLHNPFNISYKLPRNYAKRLNAPGVVCGCNFSVRRQAMRTIGGFNEYISMNGEDSDPAFRVTENGCRIVFDPEAWVLHLSAPSGGIRPSVTRTWQQEWRYIAGRPYLVFRYIKGSHKSYLYRLTRDHLRHSVLLKNNLFSPWRIFKSLAICIMGIYKGYQWSKLRAPLITVDWE
jgi:GT2 family glycosyltransferase